jgi:hypothetical protein
MSESTREISATPGSGSVTIVFTDLLSELIESKDPTPNPAIMISKNPAVIANFFPIVVSNFMVLP